MSRIYALAAALTLTLAASLPAPRPVHGSLTARLTYYEPTGERMANQQWPFEGAAACGGGIGYGRTVHVLAPDVWLSCLDSGRLGFWQVDVFSAGGRPAW